MWFINIDSWLQLRKYRLLNKQNHIYSNFFVIISMVCMHYEVSEDSFTLWSLLVTFKHSKHSKTHHISALFLTIHLVLVSWNIFVYLLGKCYSQNRTSQTGSATLECSCNFCLIFYVKCTSIMNSTYLCQMCFNVSVMKMHVVHEATDDTEQRMRLLLILLSHFSYLLM